MQPDSVGYLNLYPPLEGSVLTDGFTLTVFTSAPAMGAFFEARGASDAPCSAFGTCVYPYANFIGQPVEGTITVNNVKGYYGRSPASAIITSDTCSCSPDDAYALDDLLNVFPCFGACTDGSCYCNGPRAPIDAVALCRDENKLPE